MSHMVNKIAVIRQLSGLGASYKMMDDVADFVGGYQSPLFIPTIEFIIDMNRALSMDTPSVQKQVQQSKGIGGGANATKTALPNTYDPEYFKGISLEAARFAIDNQLVEAKAEEIGQLSAALNYVDSMIEQENKYLQSQGMAAQVMAGSKKNRAIRKRSAINAVIEKFKRDFLNNDSSLDIKSKMVQWLRRQNMIQNRQDQEQQHHQQQAQQQVQQQSQQQNAVKSQQNAAKQQSARSRQNVFRKSVEWLTSRSGIKSSRLAARAQVEEKRHTGGSAPGTKPAEQDKNRMGSGAVTVKTDNVKEKQQEKNQGQNQTQRNQMARRAELRQRRIRNHEFDQSSKDSLISKMIDNLVKSVKQNRAESAKEQTKGADSAKLAATVKPDTPKVSVETKKAEITKDVSAGKIDNSAKQAGGTNGNTVRTQVVNQQVRTQQTIAVREEIQERKFSANMEQSRGPRADDERVQKMDLKDAIKNLQNIGVKTTQDGTIVGDAKKALDKNIKAAPTPEELKQQQQNKR